MAIDDLSPGGEGGGAGGRPPERDWETEARRSAEEAQRLRKQNRELNAKALAASHRLPDAIRDRLATVSVEEQQAWVEAFSSPEVQQASQRPTAQPPAQHVPGTSPSAPGTQQPPPLPGAPPLPPPAEPVYVPGTDPGLPPVIPPAAGPQSPPGAQAASDPSLEALGHGGGGGDAPRVPEPSPPATESDRVKSRIETAKSQAELRKVVEQEQLNLRKRLRGEGP